MSEITRPFDVADTNSTAERDVRFLVTELLGANPRRSIVAHRLLTEEYLPWLLRRSVHRGRRRGMTWTGIGRVMGVSRQAVQQRFDRSGNIADLLPPVLPSKREGVSREHKDLRDDLRARRELRDVEMSDDAVPW